MKEKLENGFDRTNGINKSLEGAYIAALGNRRDNTIDIANDPKYLLLKKLVGFCLKENTDFYVFPESTFTDIFYDGNEIKNRDDEFDLNHLAWDDLIKFLFVPDENGNYYYVVWLKDISEYVDRTFLETYYEAQERRIYKFRSECIQDVMEFIDEVPKPIWNLKIEQTNDNPETDCEFTTYMSLKEILLVLNGIEDSHLMMDTLNYSEDYTGDRRYYEWGDITDDEELISILRS